MNYQRILRITNYYLFAVGYQIRFYNPKQKTFTCSLWALMGFVITALTYGICFQHHFEVSSILKITHDVSPFLGHLIRLQVLLGVKGYIFCIIQWKQINNVSNNLLGLLPENVFDYEDTKWKRSELIYYFALFSTLVVAFVIGLYIAIEMKFELPPLDTIMIAVALFVPHLMLSGSLKIYLLSLWFIRQEFINMISDFKIGSTLDDLNLNVKIIQRLNSISAKFQSISTTIQKHLLVYFGLNFNALLYSTYSIFYFEKLWYILFEGRYKRIFYAANSLIYISIFLDYILLMVFKVCMDTQVSFNVKQYQFILFKMFL